MSAMIDLCCSECGRTFDAGEVHFLCPCGRPLLCRYDTDRLASIDRSSFRPQASLWQWRELLPLPASAEPVTLGEGGTPLVCGKRLAARLGAPGLRLTVKDEGLNPTASFKARGLTAAVTMAHHLGATKLVIPTAGNAGAALAAYGARADIEVKVLAPRDVPAAMLEEMRRFGADVELVDGLITDCGAIAKRLKDEEGYYDVSTLKEPYRIEGKKTMGLELALHFDWELPDVILYPTGGGTGLIGMWKAFDEMRRAKWISGDLPRMVSVQAAGCSPIVRAFEAGADHAEPYENASTRAAGLRVPMAVGDKLMLRAIRESEGTAIAVADDDMDELVPVIGETTGVNACREGAACAAALRRLLDEGFLEGTERVVIFNTGSGLKDD